MCEANSTTSIGSDSTMCYDQSDNDSISSVPKFIQDTNDTNTDNELPDIEVAEVQCAGAGVAATAAADPKPNPDAHAAYCDKCKAGKDDKVFFFYSPKYFFPFFEYRLIKFYLKINFYFFL